MHNDLMSESGAENFGQLNKVASETQLVETKKPMLNKIPENSKKQTFMLILGSFLIVIAGVATGWQLSGGVAGSEEVPQSANITPGSAGVDEAGIADTSDFETEETGILRSGGFEGEGTHHLEKEGVSSEKFPYLMSAVIDLESFVGKEVRIWGNTIAGQEAGWLVEVGKISVVK